VDPQSAVDLQLAKVDEHLFTGCGIKDVVVDPLVRRDFGNNAVVLEIVDVVAQRLRIARKRGELTVLYEFLFENVIDRADTQALVLLVVAQYLNDHGPERLDIKSLGLFEFLIGIVGNDIHVIVLADCRGRGRLAPLYLVVAGDLALCITAELEILYFLHHDFCQHRLFLLSYALRKVYVSRRCSSCFTCCTGKKSLPYNEKTAYRAVKKLVTAAVKSAYRAHTGIFIMNK